MQEYWVLDPESLAHRFYRREGELLVEFARDAEVIAASTVPGFWVKRAWLNPEQLPEVGRSLAEVLSEKPS